MYCTCKSKRFGIADDGTYTPGLCIRCGLMAESHFDGQAPSTPVKKRGSHRYHLGATPNDAVRAVREASERLGHRRNMNDLQKAAAPFIEGCTNQKKWAQAKQDAFVEIGRQLDPASRYPTTKVEWQGGSDSGGTATATADSGKGK